MCTHILMAANRDPTVMIGGTLPLLKAGHRVGTGNTIVMEACEYYDSFLSLYPTVAVVLNIEADHLDYFKDLGAVEHSFRVFAERVPSDGWIVANKDDENTMQTLGGLDRRMITFGLSRDADVTAKNIRFLGANSQFDIYYKGRKFTDVTLHVPGMHNVKNALAATAASICLGIRPTAVKYGLAGFNGAGRRFEFKGKFNGADVYDDYAHHPGELKVLLDTVETLRYAAPTCCCWRRSLPRARRTPWASPPRIWPTGSTARASIRISVRWRPPCGRSPARATSCSPSARAIFTASARAWSRNKRIAGATAPHSRRRHSPKTGCVFCGIKQLFLIFDALQTGCRK